MPSTPLFGDAHEPTITTADAREPATAADTTDGIDYTERLHRLGGARWKRIIGAQAPYRWHVRRLDLGRTLDVGCGLGRNLLHLDGNGVGVDTNASSVRSCRSRGLSAYTADEFFGRGVGGGTAIVDTLGAFDSMLLAHVLEHLPPQAWSGLLAAYLPYVRPGGRVVIITPQERGFAADPTHVHFVDFTDVRELADRHGLVIDRQYSFPFPRRAGRLFAYNEFVTVATKPAAVESGGSAETDT